MKRHRSHDIGVIEGHKIRVIETRDITVSEIGAGIWVTAALECAAIVVTSGANSYAFDIHGREISPDQIPLSS